MVNQSANLQIEKSKSNQVYYIVWQSATEEGSAWIETKGQLDKISAILRGKPGMDVKIETHLIPRDKSTLVGLLNAQGARFHAPTSTFRFQTGG